MSALLAQLMRFSSETKEFSRPFSLKVKKEHWSIATDGCLLFAFKLAGASAGPAGLPKAEIVELLSSKANNPVEIPTAQLKEWAGEPPSALIPKGDVECDHQGILLGQVLDRRQLAYLLKTVAFPTILAWQYRPGLLAFEDSRGMWRGFIAGLKEPSDGTEPEFQIKQELPVATTPTALTVFDLADEVGD